MKRLRSKFVPREFLMLKLKIKFKKEEDFISDKTVSDTKRGTIKFIVERKWYKFAERRKNRRNVSFSSKSRLNNRKEKENYAPLVAVLELILNNLNKMLRYNNYTSFALFLFLSPFFSSFVSLCKLNPKFKAYVINRHCVSCGCVFVSLLWLVLGIIRRERMRVWTLKSFKFFSQNASRNFPLCRSSEKRKIRGAIVRKLGNLFEHLGFFLDELQYLRLCI